MSNRPFDPAQLARVAKLSSLNIDPASSDRLCVEMGGILGLIDTLQAVDTHNIEPLSHPLAVITEIPLPLRVDRVTIGDEREANLANAPQSEDGLFLVPKVIE
jgi:aspartyl-tRNA(Asn)/glutamyl-tRNA(Gln) amidotransferase subunit C